MTRAGLLHLKLGTQLFIGLALLAVVVALIAGATIRQVERSFLRAYNETEKAKTFELLHSALLDDIISEDGPRIDTTMGQLIKRDVEFASAQITDEVGNVLFQWHRPGSQIPSDANGTPQDLGYLAYSREIQFMGEGFGGLSVAWDLSATESQINTHAYVIALGVGGACFLLSMLVFMLMNSFAVAPINRIAQRVAGFRSGIHGTRALLPTFAAEELIRLDNSVNDLADFLSLKDVREQELRSAKDAAVAASRAKTEFLANMSHELRTPLNAINGFSEMMTMELFGPLGDDRYRDYVQKIHFSGSHLLSLINDILDISRVEVGKTTLETGPVDLRELVNGTLGLIKEQCQLGGLDLIANIASDVPMINADPRRIQQVLLNILSNAIKYTPAGGSVSLTLRWSDDQGAIVTVRDTGIGIAPDRISTAFEPFSRIESAYSRSHDGSGLGLPLAKVMTEMHGGTLRLESAPGAGTEATIVLPTILALPASEPARKTSRPLAASS